MKQSAIAQVIMILTGIITAIFAMTVLNTQSVESLLPLSILGSAGLIALALCHRNTTPDK